MSCIGRASVTAVAVAPFPVRIELALKELRIGARRHAGPSARSGIETRPDIIRDSRRSALRCEDARVDRHTIIFVIGIFVSFPGWPL
jgi:hypothetical protein